VVCFFLLVPLASSDSPVYAGDGLVEGYRGSVTCDILVTSQIFNSDGAWWPTFEQVWLGEDETSICSGSTGTQWPFVAHTFHGDEGITITGTPKTGLRMELEDDCQRSIA
jgi:hypothetical protein